MELSSEMRQRAAAERWDIMPCVVYFCYVSALLSFAIVSFETPNGNDAVSCSREVGYYALCCLCVCSAAARSSSWQLPCLAYKQNKTVWAESALKRNIRLNWFYVPPQTIKRPAGSVGGI